MPDETRQSETSRERDSDPLVVLVRLLARQAAREFLPEMAARPGDVPSADHNGTEDEDGEEA